MGLLHGTIWTNQKKLSSKVESMGDLARKGPCELGDHTTGIESFMGQTSIKYA